MKKKLILLSLIVIPISSYATLGESASSVTTDNKVLASSASILKTQMISASTTESTGSIGYQVSTIQATGNIIIKEYVSNGKVFAVSWSGMRNPDLQQLLGKYFPTFKTTKSINSGLRQSKISSGDLVVNIHGVTGDFHGVAYASSLVPAGFNLQDLYK